MSVQANNRNDGAPHAEKTSTPDECFLFTQSRQLWISLSVTAENEWAFLHEKGPLFNCTQERDEARERNGSERDVEERWERCKVKGLSIMHDRKLLAMRLCRRTCGDWVTAREAGQRPNPSSTRDHQNLCSPLHLTDTTAGEEITLWMQTSII